MEDFKKAIAGTFDAVAAGYDGTFLRFFPASARHIRCREEHLREVAPLRTSDGLWLDVHVLFSSGRRNPERP